MEVGDWEPEEEPRDGHPASEQGFHQLEPGKHPLHSATDTGMWECPNFYPVAMEGKLGVETPAHGDGLKYVLKVSMDSTRYEYYALGLYNLHLDKYTPDDILADNRT